MNIFFSEDFIKHESAEPRDLKRYIAHVHKHSPHIAVAQVNPALYIISEVRMVNKDWTTQIHWPNCEILLGRRLRRWANIIPIKPL